MKKLLLLILLIPNLVMAEKVFYCQDELHTGIVKKNGVWKSGKFKPERHTIKFNDDFTRLEGIDDYPLNCSTPYTHKTNIIVCEESIYKDTTFKFDKLTKRYVYSFLSPFGYVENNTDTNNMSAGTCESF